MGDFNPSKSQIIRLCFDSDLNAFKVTDRSDFFLSVAEGNIPGRSSVNKFGENPDIDTGTAEDIWDFGGPYFFSTTAAIDSISSSNGSDDQDITIEGLDENWLEVEQTVALNGQTRVALTTSLIRINRAFNVDDSSVQGNAYIYENTALSSGVPIDGTKVRALIRDGNNQTLMAIYSVPAGKTAFVHLVTFNISRDKTTTADVTWRIQEFGKKFRVQYRTSVLSTGSSDVMRPYIFPVPVPAKSDIKARCESVSTNGTSIGSTFCISLKDD